MTHSSSGMIASATSARWTFMPSRMTVMTSSVATLTNVALDEVERRLHAHRVVDEPVDRVALRVGAVVGEAQLLELPEQAQRTRSRPL